PARRPPGRGRRSGRAARSPWRKGSVALVEGRTMTDREWIARFAAALETEAPTDAEFDQVLALAARAAHASSRTAAPVACGLAGRARLGLDQALEAAAGLAADV